MIRNFFKASPLKEKFCIKKTSPEMKTTVVCRLFHVYFVHILRDYYITSLFTKFFAKILKILREIYVNLENIDIKTCAPLSYIYTQIDIIISIDINLCTFFRGVFY